MRRLFLAGSLLLSVFPAFAGAPLSEAFLAFEMPAGVEGQPQLYRGGEAFFIGSGAPRHLLFSFAPQTLAATPWDGYQVEPVGHAGGSLLLEMHHGGGLLAADQNGIATLPGQFPVNAATAADGAGFYTDSTFGQELWQSDGTAAGTRELLDLDPLWTPHCISAYICGPDVPTTIRASGSKTYFDAGPPPAALDLYVYDREDGEQRRLTNFSDPLNSASFLDLEPFGDGSLAFFYSPFSYTGVVGFDYRLLDLELWVSGGQPENTRRLMAFDSSDNSLPHFLHALGDQVLIVVRPWPGNINPGADGPDEVWVYRQGADAAEKIATFAQLDSYHLDRHWQVAGDQIYFPAMTAEGGAELWTSDGTAAGTRQVADLNPGPENSNPFNLFALADGRLVFSAIDGEKGTELFITNGQSGGTFLLADVEPGAGSSYPSFFLQHGNRLFFMAHRTGHGGYSLFYLDLPADPSLCPADRLCLGNGRFEAKVEVATADGTFAGRREHSQDDSGVFSFFSAGNWEMLVKVLDGCTINDHFWVFSSAATDVEYTLTVIDRANGETFVHHHAGGEPAPALAEIEAFPTCGLPPPEPQYVPTPPGPAAAPVCGDGEALCFGQLRIRVDWQTATGSGAAAASPYGTAESGLFSFFSENNQEMLVKVLDACAINGHRWLLASAATDVEFTLKVRNSFNPNENRDYHHPGGSPAPAIIDLDSFGAGCGAP